MSETLIETARRRQLTDNELYVLFGLIHDLYSRDKSVTLMPEYLTDEEKQEVLGDIEDDDMPLIQMLQPRFKLSLTAEVQVRMKALERG